jgi:hypothetical protein
VLDLTGVSAVLDRSQTGVEPDRSRSQNYRTGGAESR